MLPVLLSWFCAYNKCVYRRVNVYFFCQKKSTCMEFLFIYQIHIELQLPCFNEKKWIYHPRQILESQTFCTLTIYTLIVSIYKIQEQLPLYWDNSTCISIYQMHCNSLSLYLFWHKTKLFTTFKCDEILSDCVNARVIMQGKIEKKL